jgi:lipopolysaccharide export system permease protein
MFTIVSRYLLRETAKTFGLVLVGVISIYVAVDFFEKIDDFIDAELPMRLVFTFFLNQIPFVVAMITPVGVLLGVLIVFGLMSKNNEILALRCGGVSVYTLAKPMVAMGVCASLALFFLAEVVVPITMARANDIWLTQVRNERIVASKQKNIWIRDDRAIVHIKYYNPTEKAIHGVSINRFDANFKLIQRLDAPNGVYKDKHWVLSDVMVQDLPGAKQGGRTSFHATKNVMLNFKPEDLKRVVKKSEEMSFAELKEYIRKVESEGYDATLYRVDYQAKMALPFVCIIMSLIGVGIGIQGRLKEGLPMSVTYGIGIAFCYWVVFSFCVSLGYGGMLPPAVAAWAGNLVFLCFGSILVLNAE